MHAFLECRLWSYVKNNSAFSLAYLTAQDRESYRKEDKYYGLFAMLSKVDHYPVRGTVDKPERAKAIFMRNLTCSEALQLSALGH
ncbi:hypothetical protein HDU99_009562, partial [Rhizoclosmatium hyalinum]